MAVRSKTQFCDLSIAGVADSSPAEGMDVRLLCLLFRLRPLKRAHHSVGGILPRVCLLVCDLEISTVRQPKSALYRCAAEGM